MSIIARMFLILLTSSVLIAEDATIPYGQLYKLCSFYSDSLRIRIVCRVESQEPLKLTIQTKGVVVSEVASDNHGFIRLPLNEKWISENAVLHVNRPKGTMTMTAKFVVYPCTKFSMNDGSFDLMDYLVAMKRSTAQIAQLRDIFKDEDALDAGMSESIPFTIDPADGAKAILRYTINGVEKTDTFPAIGGKVVVQVKGLLDASAASISVVPKDARVVFLEPDAEMKNDAAIIP